MLGIATYKFDKNEKSCFLYLTNNLRIFSIFLNRFRCISFKKHE